MPAELITALHLELFNSMNMTEALTIRALDVFSIFGGLYPAGAGSRYADVDAPDARRRSGCQLTVSSPFHFGTSRVGLAAGLLFSRRVIRPSRERFPVLDLRMRFHKLADHSVERLHDCLLLSVHGIPPSC